MIPTPIPRDLLDGSVEPRVYTAPDGVEGIDPLEAIAGVDAATELPAVVVRLELELGELERLQAGEPVWLTFLGQLTPFRVQVGLGA